MDQSTNDVRRANWLTIINQCQTRPSDMSVKQWLVENGIKEKAYYYWLRKFDAYHLNGKYGFESRHQLTLTERLTSRWVILESLDWKGLF